MLVLFETAAGQALFKVLDKGKVSSVDDVWKEFESPESANKVLKLKAFNAFEDTVGAVAAATSLVDGKMDKDLKKFLKKHAEGSDLAVADTKVGGMIKEKLGINCVHGAAINELMRGIRSQIDALLPAPGADGMKAMTLGLCHSLSRYKLKFSADKVDTMIVQAIGLLDELDKEINTYAMRSREWFGWHFPEMSKIVADNVQYCKCVLKMDTRDKVKDTDFSDILEEDVERTLREVAEVSMGTEIAVIDVENIQSLCTQVVDLVQYRAELFEYLKQRMAAIAPNLTVMVGELVGARLISHAGSLMNLAKHPASTVQILGAEKALFRALKSKHETPKYGLIYHASLIGQAQPKFKGKISRVLAAKTALAIRVDALGDNVEATIGYENRAKVEARLRQLQSGGDMSVAAVSAPTAAKYDASASSGAGAYNTAADSTMVDAAAAGGDKKEKKPKRKASEVAEGGAASEAQNAKQETNPKKDKK
jgi:nucleolar protein 58